MDAPLLTTKFHIPKPDAAAVVRARLVEKLDAGLTRKLTLVSAPAGFGKSTLLAEWLKAPGRPAAWLSLDQDENDPVLFWLYFIGALQRLDGRVGQAAVNMLRTLPPPPVQSVLVTLINDVSDLLPESTIVLEDCHTVSNRAIYDGLNFLLDRLPPGMHLVVCGRADPPLRLARLRAAGQLTEIRADDLRFTVEETEALFERRLPAHLSDQEAAMLSARTEGWAVGLQMAALSMIGREDRSRFVAEFGGSNRYILDYLTDEVLDQQEPDTRSFLLETSILERMNGPLCEALTGRTDGREMLERLEAANLFVVPLDDERYWYRYHHLFADLLRAQFVRAEPVRSAPLYVRASEWFERQGLVPEAIRYALAGHDPERAASLSESVSLETVFQNKAGIVFDWVSKLPDDLVAGHPRLCVAAAWAALSLRRFGDVERFLTMAAAELAAPAPDAPGPSRRYLGAHLAAQRAFLAQAAADFDASIDLSLEAIRDAGPDETLLSTVMMNLGVSYWNNGNLASGRDYLQRAAEMSEKASNYYFTLISLSHLAEIEAEMGHLAAAGKHCERAIALGTEWGGGHPIPATGYAFVALGEVLLEWDRLAEAETAVLRGVQLAEASDEPELKVRAYLCLARFQLAAGDAVAAEDAFRQAHAVEPVFAYLKKQIYEREAQSRLFEGRLREAADWAEAQGFQLEHPPADPVAEPAYLTFLQVRLAQGKAQGVLAPLQSLRGSLEAQGRTVAVFRVMLLRATALAKLGKTDDALAVLDDVLTLTEPEGYVRVLVDLGEPVGRLLGLVVRRRGTSKHAAAVLKAFHREEPSSAAADDALTDQEKAILRLMASGRSNKEISQELYLSLNTVKWYSSRIYGKLAAGTRAEAVKRAYELGLL